MKFQSSNSLLKSFHLFANPLHLWDKLNSFRFKAWLLWLKKLNQLRLWKKTFKKLWKIRARIACLKVFIFLRTHYIYEISWTLSDLKLDYFDWKNWTNCVYEKKTFKKLWKIRAQIACLKVFIFLRTHYIYEISWTLSDLKLDYFDWKNWTNCVYEKNF